MSRKLSDLRVCDACDGPVGLAFYVVRSSIAVVNKRAVEELQGMHQFFGRRAPLDLVENFAPHAHDAITIAMDDPEYKTLGSELFICQRCYMDKPLDLPVLLEKLNARRKRDEERVQSEHGLRG